MNGSQYGARPSVGTTTRRGVSLPRWQVVYLEDRERTLDTPTDKIMLSLTALADKHEREKALRHR